MRSDIIRLYKSVHTWTGILTGLALFIAFYAGAITVFEDPLARWLSPPQREATTPLDKAGELIEKTLAARPDAGKEFYLYLEDDHRVRLVWEKRVERTVPDNAPWTAHLEEDGQLALVQRHPSHMAQFIDTLHRTAGVPGDAEIGEHFMGVVSVLYAVALVSGLIVVLPSLVKDFLALRLGKNLKRFWLDAHNLVGVVSLPFHLVMAMTAVVFAFHDHLYDLEDKLVYGGQLRAIMKASNPLAGMKKDLRPATMVSPQQVLEKVRDLEPNFHPLILHYRDGGIGSAVIRVLGEDPRYLLRGKGFLLMEGRSGEIINTDYFPGRHSGLNTVVSSIFALHVASYGGATVRWSYFFLGLAGAFLFYSGNLLWLETRRRQEKHHGSGVVQSRASRVMAVLTVGISLGCVAGISLSLAVGKVLSGKVDDINAWHQGIYYALFLGAVAWAFFRGAARAGVDLARLAAVSTLAIPLTTLLAWAIPSLGLWANGGAALGVDAVAIVGAISLFWIARHSAQRIKDGPRDSVWSHPPSSNPQSLR